MTVGASKILYLCVILRWRLSGIFVWFSLFCIYHSVSGNGLLGQFTGRKGR